MPVHAHLANPKPVNPASAPLRVFAPPASGQELTGVPFIVASPALRDVIDRAKRVAASTMPVLVQGESGTGKELLGALIHESSPRRQRCFIKVNCAAFSESLAESELFGHDKGAFTGADQRHSGYFERADGGSLLLDEIGEMPLRLQAKLLRVLEDGAFHRVGGEEPIQVNVRLVATTNRDLEREVAQGAFRRDLFYRLNAMLIHVPPLRDRPEDIAPLVANFLERFGDRAGQRVLAVAPGALELLQAYSWPGNVRQLRNVIQHACVMARTDCIQPEDLPALRETPMSPPPSSGTIRTLAEMERRLILDTLRELGGNRTAAALRLGVTVRTLQNKLKIYAQRFIDPDHPELSIHPS